MLYKFTVIVQEGEYENRYDQLVEAKNFNEAYEKADRYVRNFYGDSRAQKIGDSQYSFFGGELICSMEGLCKTTKEEWIQEQFDLAMI